MSWDLLLGYLSGLYLLTPPLDHATLVRSLIVLHGLDSGMCWLFAHNNGYPKNLWAVLGFIFGVWAVGVLIMLPRRRPSGVRD